MQIMKCMASYLAPKQHLLRKAKKSLHFLLILKKQNYCSKRIINLEMDGKMIKEQFEQHHNLHL